MGIKVEIISKETIKPSSPTPHHLKTFKLSFFDQLAPSIYVPIILFYELNTGDHEVHDDDVQTHRRHHLDRLKISLSETLTRFYPIAGRIKDDDDDNTVVDCTDDGVDYLEAKVVVVVDGQNMSDDHVLPLLVKHPDVHLLKQFLPCECDPPYPSRSGSGSGSRVLLAVQINFFECGSSGLVIGLCVSHKIADASSLVTFINCWASTARGSTTHNEGFTGPRFELASLFPCRDLMGFMPETGIVGGEEEIVTKRFVFDASKISAVRERLIKVNNPTRVETVSAFIWKRFMDMDGKRKKVGLLLSTGPALRSYGALHAVNLRKRMVPALEPLHSFGNMYVPAIAAVVMKVEDEEKKDKDEYDYDYDYLVGQLRDAIHKIDDEYVRKLIQLGDGYLRSINEYVEKIRKGEIGLLLNFSSWCGFPVYGADFGWGKPIWVSIGSLPYKNVVVLVDTRNGDGIEAWVNMTKDDMEEFENDQQLLQFLS